jgi:acyl dehydratase
MPQRFDSIASVLAADGADLGATDWLTITQQRVDLFAEATGDHQWIHVDPVRAQAGPFGGCVAHGYLTLALANLFLPQLVHYEQLRMGVNYGCNKVRFPAPVKVGARVRGRGRIVGVEASGEGVLVTVRISVEVEGSERPGCVADTVSLLYFNQDQSTDQSTGAANEHA